jgi:hypothetical protein
MGARRRRVALLWRGQPLKRSLHIHVALGPYGGHDHHHLRSRDRRRLLFTSSAGGRPQRAPAAPTASAAAILANAALPNRPSPAVACGLHTTWRGAKASRSSVPVLPQRCPVGQGTGRSATRPSPGADAAPTRRQGRARRPARPAPAARPTLPPWAPGGRPCWSGATRPRRATPRRPPAPGAPPGRRPPRAPAAGGGRAHATAGRGWPDALARPAWSGALRHPPTGPGPPPRPQSPCRSRTPRPPRPRGPAGMGSSRPPRSAPGPPLAWCCPCSRAECRPACVAQPRRHL